MVLHSSWVAGETRSQSTKFVMQLFFTKIETFLNGKETLNPSVHPSNNYLLRTYHVFWLKGGIEQKWKPHLFTQNPKEERYMLQNHWRAKKQELSSMH